MSSSRGRHQVMTSSAGTSGSSAGGGAAGTQSYTDLAKNMAEQLELRRSDWNQQVAQMQDDFFKVKMSEPISTSRVSPTVSNDVTSSQLLPDGTKLFRVRFDLHDFRPEEISVRVEKRRLAVSARQVDGPRTTGSRNNVVREFNKRVDIPPEVDTTQLVSRLAYDGILTVEAPYVKRRQEFVADSDIRRTRAPPSYETIPQATSRDSSCSVETGSSWMLDDDKMESEKCRIIETADGCRVLKLVVDLGSPSNTDHLYDSDDITVNIISNRRLLVSARREMTSSRGGGVTSRREFSRELDVSEPLDVRAVRAVLVQGSQRLWIAAGVNTGMTGESSYSRGGRAGLHQRKVTEGTLIALLPISGRQCKVILH